MKVWLMTCALVCSNPLAMAATPSAPPAAATTSKVIGLRGEKTKIHTREQDKFIKSGELLASEITAPLPIVDTAPQGYVKVMLPGGEGWLKRGFVVIEPSLPLAEGVECGTQVSRKDSVESGVVRGAGQACSK